jgi:hypothetical protein
LSNVAAISGVGNLQLTLKTPLLFDLLSVSPLILKFSNQTISNFYHLKPFKILFITPYHTRLNVAYFGSRNICFQCLRVALTTHNNTNSPSPPQVAVLWIAPICWDSGGGRTILIPYLAYLCHPPKGSRIRGDAPILAIGGFQPAIPCDPLPSRKSCVAGKCHEDSQCQNERCF